MTKGKRKFDHLQEKLLNLETNKDRGDGLILANLAYIVEEIMGFLQSKVPSGRMEFSYAESAYRGFLLQFLNLEIRNLYDTFSSRICQREP